MNWFELFMGLWVREYIVIGISIPYSDIGKVKSSDVWLINWENFRIQMDLRKHSNIICLSYTYIIKKKHYGSIEKSKFQIDITIKWRISKKSKHLYRKIKRLEYWKIEKNGISNCEKIDTYQIIELFENEKSNFEIW